MSVFDEPLFMFSPVLEDWIFVRIVGITFSEDNPIPVGQPGHFDCYELERVVRDGFTRIWEPTGERVIKKKSEMITKPFKN